MTSQLLEIALEDGELSGWVRWPKALAPQPGQYLLARALEAPQALPAALAPLAVHDGALQLAPLPADWNAGMTLQLRGLLGSGFHLPSAARRVALAAVSGHPARLALLLQSALAQGAAVVLYCAQVPDRLPDAVEALPLEQLPEAPAWADYLALEMDLPQARAWRSLLRLAPHAEPGCTAEVLVNLPMPCGGTGECGLCALETLRGWSLACKDGPVFHLRDLAEN